MVFPGEFKKHVNKSRSQIFSQSPLSRNQDIPQCKSVRADACEYGLVSQRGLPMEKAYRFDTSIQLQKAARRCRGHGPLQHEKIEGGHNTAGTTVYVIGLIRALIADISAFVKKLVSSWNLLVLQEPISHELCTLQSDTSANSQFIVDMLSSSATVPQASKTQPSTVRLHPAQNFTLQPNEWRGISFGLRFRSMLRLI